jgi:hypothetical protein
MELNKMPYFNTKKEPEDWYYNNGFWKTTAVRRHDECKIIDFLWKNDTRYMTVNKYNQKFFNGTAAILAFLVLNKLPDENISPVSLILP